MKLLVVLAVIAALRGSLAGPPEETYNLVLTVRRPLGDAARAPAEKATLECDGMPVTEPPHCEFVKYVRTACGAD